MIRRPPRSTLFPYTPLSRSSQRNRPASNQATNPRDNNARARRVWGFGCPAKEIPIRVALRSPNASTMQGGKTRSEEHTSELQSRLHLVCRLLLEKKKNTARCTDERLSFVRQEECLVGAGGLGGGIESGAVRPAYLGRVDACEVATEIARLATVLE